MYELQTVDAPGLEALGMRVELRELTYGHLRRVMSEASSPEGATEAVLAASLHVDGVPLGVEGLQALPGRFTGAISRALAATLRLHGMIGADEAPPPAREAANEAASHEDAASGEA